MSQEPHSAQYYMDLLKAVEHALDEGSWEETLFLRAMGKELREIRDELRQALNINPETDAANTGESTDKANAGTAESAAIASDKLEVFLSLYCADGNTLKKWEAVLAGASKAATTRPIYKTEADVQAMIRAKSNPQNEAYCAVHIQRSDIARPFTGVNPRDRLGHELLVLKERAVKLENVTRFVHKSMTYRCEDGKLVLVSEG